MGTERQTKLRVLELSHQVTCGSLLLFIYLEEPLYMYARTHTNTHVRANTIRQGLWQWTFTDILTGMIDCLITCYGSSLARGRPRDMLPELEGGPRGWNTLSHVSRCSLGPRHCDRLRMLPPRSWSRAASGSDWRLPGGGKISTAPVLGPVKKKATLIKTFKIHKEQLPPR